MATQFEKRRAKAVSEKEAEDFTPLGTAQDVLWDAEKKTYLLVSVEYNHKTDQAEIVGTQDLGRDQAMAMYKINELFANKIIMGRR